MNPFIGHDSQLCGAEEYRLVGGRGDGMRILHVWNGRGLDLTISVDRCADIARLWYRGGNCGYFSPCGYVAPTYYDGVDNGFLKSFTAGFLTTCGLNAVGTPCTDAGETLPLHGTISNTPAERFFWDEDDTAIYVHARMCDETIFGRKLRLCRQIVVGKREDTVRIFDTVENTGDRDEPLEILYHMNLGYPLLSPESELYIPSSGIRARDAHAQAGIAVATCLASPQPQFQEQCYYHDFDGDGLAAVYSPLLDSALAVAFDTSQLEYFTQWKMLGVRDYVLGLEPGNCHPDGRARMRSEGKLDVLAPGQSRAFCVTIRLMRGRAAFDALKRERT